MEGAWTRSSGTSTRWVGFADAVAEPVDAVFGRVGAIADAEGGSAESAGGAFAGFVAGLGVGFGFVEGGDAHLGGEAFKGGHRRHPIPAHRPRISSRNTRACTSPSKARAIRLSRPKALNAFMIISTTTRAAKLAPR